MESPECLDTIFPETILLRLLVPPLKLGRGGHQILESPQIPQLVDGWINAFFGFSKKLRNIVESLKNRANNKPKLELFSLIKQNLLGNLCVNSIPRQTALKEGFFNRIPLIKAIKICKELREGVRASILCSGFAHKTIA